MTPISELLFPGKDSRGTPLHWGRADIDGMPFRGNAVPMYTEEEFDARCRPVGEPNCRLFTVSDAKDREEYLAVLRMIVNGRASLLCRLPPVVDASKAQVYVYLEWNEHYMCDAKPAPHGYPGTQRMAVHGSNELPTYPGAGSP